MPSRPTARLTDDSAENSIMQTISIAVSAILIAAGLITAPSLINNARDVNAKTDLANLAYAEEYAMANDGRYYEDVVNDGSDTSLWERVRSAPDGQVAYTLSDGVTYHEAFTCTSARDGQDAYLLRAVSASGMMLFRSSESTRVSSNANDLELPECIWSAATYGSFISAPDGANGGGGTMDTTAFSD